MRCLVTGANGFLGGLLVTALGATDAVVRAGVRDPDAYVPAPGVEVAAADLTEVSQLTDALEGVDVAYYLVHAMGSDADAAAADRLAATNFRTASRAVGVRRVVYVGAVGYDPDGDSSEHLRSRHEVENLLAEAAPEFVALRASMAVGAGSGSFRPLAEVVHRMPAFPLPPWRTSRSQPIAGDDLVACLVAARSVPVGRYDVVGPDELTVEEMMRTIAELLDKPFRAVPLPVSLPGLEGAVTGAVTDEDRTLITSLLESLQTDTLAPVNATESVFSVTPTPFRVAARAALAELELLPTSDG